MMKMEAMSLILESWSPHARRRVVFHFVHQVQVKPVSSTQSGQANNLATHLSFVEVLHWSGVEARAVSTDASGLGHRNTVFVINTCRHYATQHHPYKYHWFSWLLFSSWKSMGFN